METKSILRICVIAFLIKRYFPYYPAPDDSPDWRWRTGFNCVLRSVYNLAVVVRDYHSSDMGVSVLRNVGPPNHDHNPETTEEVVTFENYQIHIWRQIVSEDSVEPTILFLHGGGWMIGDIPLHRQFYSNIAVVNKMTVVAVEYRRSPEAIFPAAFTDCYDAGVHIFNEAAKYNIDATRIIVSGDSAGGQLSLSVGMYLHQHGYPVKGIVAMYPMTQIVTGTTRSYIDNDGYAITRDGASWAVSLYVHGNLKLLHGYQNGELYNAALAHDKELIMERFQYKNDNYKFSNTSKSMELDKRASQTIFDARVSPLLATSSMLKHMPPTHIYAMQYDILRDDSILFYNAAKQAGNENIELTVWEGAFHIEQSYSKYWINKSPMPQSDIWITDYLNTISQLANA